MVTYHGFLGCSLDGFIAGPNGELEWLAAFENTGYEEFFASIDAIAMGRNSYDAIRQSMPDYYKGVPVHVLSTTMRTGTEPALGTSSVTVHSNLAGLREAVHKAGCERVYVDGGRTVQTMIAAGLLTDLVVTRVPVLIGEGLPLFGPEPGPLRPQLIRSHHTHQGAVQSMYSFA